MRDFNLPWLIGGCLAAVAGVLLSAPQASSAFAQPGESADRMFVTQQDDRTFRIDRAESVEALVTFLSPTTLRVRILPPEPATSSLPE